MLAMPSTTTALSTSFSKTLMDSGPSQEFGWVKGQVLLLVVRFTNEPSNPPSSRSLTGLAFIQIAFAVFAKVFNNVYLHPLSRFPGPKLYAASPTPVAVAQLSGKFHHFTQAAHQRYGAVVRISPNELSFVSAAAWSDIYARREGRAPLPRDKTFFNDMLVDPNTLTMADDQNHARLW